MSITMLHGFLCAILSGPMIMPNEWLPEIWGEEGPRFDSEVQMGRIVGLLMRFYNGVADELARNPLRFKPLLDVSLPNDAEAWCAGYVHGMAAREDAWSPS